MGWNTPDDWGMYYSNCGYCGSRVHASEGGCGCTEEAEKCEGCGGGPRWRYDTRAEQEGLHRIEDLTEVDGKYFCEEHLLCGCCDEGPDIGDEESHTLKWSSEVDELLCPTCNVEDDHYCAKDGPLLEHLAKKTGQ